MIYVLPQKTENKKRRIFSRITGRKKSFFSEESFSLNGENHTLLYVDNEFLKSEDFYKMLTPYKGKILFHPSLKKAEFSELYSDISPYGKLCVFLPFLEYAKGGCLKNTLPVICDNNGALCREIPKLLMYVKGIRIITSSEKYDSRYVSEIYETYGVKIKVSDGSEDLPGNLFCRVDFDSAAESGELSFVFENRVNRLLREDLKITFSDEEKILFDRLASLGMCERDLYGMFYTQKQTAE